MLYTKGMSLTSDDLADIKQLMSSLLSSQDKRFDAIEERFEKIDKRFEKIDKRFDAIEERFDKRFEEVDKRFEDLDEKLNEILNAVGGEFSEQSEQIADHEQRTQQLERQTA